MGSANGGDDRTLLAPRFPAVSPGRPHYESIYLTAARPDGRAIWVRYTVRKAPGADPVGSVWCTLFGAGEPRGAKASGPVATDGERLVLVGDHGHVTPNGASGALAVPGLEVGWDLTFADGAAPLEHLPWPWLYAAPVPRTKSTSPYPDLRLDGTLTVDGETVEVDGWRGMLGHNWGSEHAHRWVWLRGAGFAESPDSWLDVVVGRIRVGPVTLPWIANGVLCLGGRRHRIGGMGRRCAVAPHAGGLDLTVPGDGLAVRVLVDAPAERSVGWRYADPSGGDHLVRNCSNAAARVTVSGSRPRTLTTTWGAVYELGGSAIDPGVVLQPFPDR